MGELPARDRWVAVGGWVCRGGCVREVAGEGEYAPRQAHTHTHPPTRLLGAHSAPPPRRAPPRACASTPPPATCPPPPLAPSPPPGLRIKENKEVYEGEVTELTPEYTESAVRLLCCTVLQQGGGPAPGGCGKATQCGEAGTSKGRLARSQGGDHHGRRQGAGGRRGGGGMVLVLVRAGVWLGPQRRRRCAGAGGRWEAQQGRGGAGAGGAVDVRPGAGGRVGGWGGARGRR